MLSVVGQLLGRRAYTLGCVASPACHAHVVKSVVSIYEPLRHLMDDGETDEIVDDVGRTSSDVLW